MSDDWFDKTYRSNETTPAELDARVLSAARSAVRRRRFPGAAVVAGAGRTVRRRPLLAVAGTAVEAATAAFVALPVLDRSGFELPPPQAEPELVLERSFMRLATPETETLGAASGMESPEAAIAETASADASGPPETLDVLSPTAVPVEAPPPPRVTTAGDDDAPTVTIGDDDRSRGDYPRRPAFRASDVPPEGMLEPGSPDVAVTAYGAEVEFRVPLSVMEAITIAGTHTEEDGPGEYARGHGAPLGEEEMAGASIPRSGASPGPRPFGRETTADAPIRRESITTRLAAPAAACIPNVLRGPLGGPGRADEAHWCPDGRGGLEIDFVWDGGAPCPSRLVVEDAADVRAVLDGNVLVAGRARYRCIEGRWARIE